MPDTDEFLGVMIADVARLLRTAFDRRVRKLGLTRAQWLVLTRVHRRPGASQSELAELMEVEKASAGRMIDRLEAKGWVVRRAQDGDRRVKRVYLTPEAERVHKRIWRIAEVTLDDALANVSAQEGAQLRKLLARVKRNLVVVVDGGVPARNGAAAARSRPMPRHTRDANGRANGRHDGRVAP
jgi:DNA-binding MarR family transcriptional regulator